MSESNYWKGLKPDIVVHDEMLLAIGNPDGPTDAIKKAQWAKVYGVPDSWEYVGTTDAGVQWDVQNTYVKFNSLKEHMAKMALEFKSASPWPPPSQTMYFGIKDVNGEEVKIPVQGLPEFTMNYFKSGDAPEMSIEHAAIEIDTVYVESSDGDVNVIKGPFTVKGSYGQVPQPPPSVPEWVADYIQIEHNGQIINLHVGDTFTIDYNVSLDSGVAAGVAFTHAETVKVLDFGYKKKKNPGPSPFLLNQEPKNTQVQQASDSMKVKKHKNQGTWHFEWFEKKECFLIGGHYKNKRYEIVLGQVIPPGGINDSFDFDTSEWPVGLRNLIMNCNKSLAAHISGKSDVLKHPKLHEIMVKCPGFGKPLREKAWAGHNPVCDYNETNLYSMIQHVNDAHRWTREAIAEWIDTLDEQPVFYPVIESQRVANSAKVVVLQPPVQKGTRN